MSVLALVVFAVILHHVARLAPLEGVGVAGAATSLRPREASLEVGCVLGAALELTQDRLLVSLTRRCKDVVFLIRTTLSASACANRGSRLALLHVVDAALSDATVVEGALARRVALLEAAETRLSQAQAHGAARCLRLRCHFRYRERLKNYRVRRAQHQLSNLKA